MLSILGRYQKSWEIYGLMSCEWLHFMYYRLTIDRGSEKSLIQILSRIKLNPHLSDLLLVFTALWIWLLNLRCQKCNVYIAWLSCEVKIRFYKSLFLLHEHCEVGFVQATAVLLYTYFKGVPQYHWVYHDGIIKLKISWINWRPVTCEMLKKKTSSTFSMFNILTLVPN